MRVLFVCLGNLCRSPTAEGIFRNLVQAEGLDQQVVVDSAGTGDWNVGLPPDERAIEAAARRGIDIAGQRGRQVAPGDFQTFDYVFAMDRKNLRDLQGLRRGPDGASPQLFLEDREVPDPYYGGEEGFEVVLDLLEAGARTWLQRIRTELGDPSV